MKDRPDVRGLRGERKFGWPFNPGLSKVLVQPIVAHEVVSLERQHCMLFPLRLAMSRRLANKNRWRSLVGLVVSENLVGKPI